MECTCLEGQLELPRHFWVADSVGRTPGIWSAVLIIINKNKSGFPPTVKTILWLRAELNIQPPFLPPWSLSISPSSFIFLTRGFPLKGVEPGVQLHPPQGVFLLLSLSDSLEHCSLVPQLRQNHLELFWSPEQCQNLLSSHLQ